MVAQSTLQLFPYQQDGVKFLTSGYHRLLADDMGLGKTIQVIAAGFNTLKAKSVLIICPAQVKIHWARKIAEWSTHPQNICILMDGKSKIPPGATVIIVNYELLLRDAIYRQLLARGEVIGYELVVCDEAHYLKTRDTKRTQRVLGAKSFMRFARFKWMLTGTPVLNRPAELYPMLRTLAPEVIDPYLDWVEYGKYYCGGYAEGNDENFKGASNIEELAEKLKGFMLRRVVDDVMDQLPSVVTNTVELDIDMDEILVAAGLEDLLEMDFLPEDLLAWLPMATVRRLMAEAKIPQSLSYIKDMLAEVDKVVVFAHHRHVIESIAKGLGEYNPVIVYGGMNSTQKQNNIDQFIVNSACRVIILQTQAGGTGVDGLQGVCNYCVFVELDWSPGVMDQAVARLKRTGQRGNTVFVHYLVIPNSLDTIIDGKVVTKRKVITKLIVKNEVSDMSIEQSLARIADALEALAGKGGGVPAAAAAPSPTPAPAKGKGKAAAAAPPAPPPADPPIQPPAPAPAQAQLTLDDVLKATAMFIGSTPDRDGNKQIIREQINPQFGVSTVNDLQPAQFAAFLEELKKGPAGFPGQTVDTEGV